MSGTRIMTLGGYFDPLNPLPEHVDVVALARGLRQPRFARQTLEDVPIDEHMLRTLRIWCALYERGPSRHDGADPLRCEGLSTPTGDTLEWLGSAMALLVHDAAEGFIGDRLGPIKTDADRELERHVLDACILALLDHMRAYWRYMDLRDHYLGLVSKLRADAWGSPDVKAIDWLACRVEALLWQPGAHDWAAPKPEEREAFLVAMSVAVTRPLDLGGMTWLDTVRWLTEQWLDAHVIAVIGEDDADERIEGIARVVCRRMR